MNSLKIYVGSKAYENDANTIQTLLPAEIVDKVSDILADDLVLKMTDEEVSLSFGELSLKVDYEKMIPRIKAGTVNQEMLVKAARIKGKKDGLSAIDATAGFGEDSLLLAAAGFNVKLYEYNPVIAFMLKDAVERYKSVPGLSSIVSRMEVHNGDSIAVMKSYKDMPDTLNRVDVVLLDPMFPERNKSALIGKKFQILQRLEMPCSNEQELFDAAKQVNPRKLVIKRPLKGTNLAGIKPDYVISGKAVRYDCFTYA